MNPMMYFVKNIIFPLSLLGLSSFVCASDTVQTQLAKPESQSVTQSESQQVAGDAVFVSGKVELKRDDQVIVLKKGMSIYMGDTLETGADGFLYMQTIDKGLLILRPGTAVNIVTYQFSNEHPEASKVRYDLSHGVMRHVSGEAAQKAKQNFRLNTPIAALGVRGTDFSIFADQQLARVSVRSGGIVMSALSDTCTVSSLGPCEGVDAIELFADTQQLLQIQAGETRPVFVDARQVPGPDVTTPPRQDELDVPNHRLGDISMNELTLSSEANMIKPSPEPYHPVFSWGRYVDVVGAPDSPVSLFSVIKGKAFTAQRGGYVLGLPSLSSSLPETGNFNFSLAMHEGMLLNNDVYIASTQATKGVLSIDFGKQVFHTELDLIGNGEAWKLTSSGLLNPSGEFNSWGGLNSQSIKGVVAGDSGTQAGYVYSQSLGQGYQLNGITIWKR